MNSEQKNINVNSQPIANIFNNPSQNPDEVGEPPTAGRTEPASIDDIKFDTKPMDLIKYLQQYIIGQDNAIEVLATKICTHFHRMQLERQNPHMGRIVGNVKSNILLIGPTGVGKTYLVRLIAQKLNVPFVKGDATKFSETGYVGGDVEDLVRELVYQVNGNIKLAEHGIIYIDEIDKIASSAGGSGPDVSRSGVQRNLLKLMEETEVDLKVPHDLASQMEAVMETQRTGKASRKKINTHNILFVMSGAFTDLPPIIARRMQKGGMGFTGDDMTGASKVDFLLNRLHSQDMIEYGFESEFIGRLPVVSFLNELDEDGLFGILKNPYSSVIAGKVRDFEAYGITLTFDDEALRLIAREAHHYKIGARGLVRVMERLLMPFERTLPSVGVTHLNVTAEIYHDSEQVLKTLIPQHALEQFSADFTARTGIKIDFSPSVREKIATLTGSMNGDIVGYLTNALKDYEYGLKLAGKESFTVTTAVLSNPADYLSKLIKANYSGEKLEEGNPEE